MKNILITGATGFIGQRLVKAADSKIKILSRKKQHDFETIVCDFEKGRRASPGIGTVRKFVEAMVEYDKAQGGKIVSSMFAKDNSSAVYDIREFNTGTAISRLIQEIDGEILSGNEHILERPIYGYFSYRGFNFRRSNGLIANYEANSD